MINIPWYLKIVTLLFGLKYRWLGLFLIILDSHFHITSNLETLNKSSPDWIISRLIFDRNGFSEKIHKIMGYLLVFGSFLAILYLLTKLDTMKPFIEPWWFGIIQPITLIIISLAILLKNMTLIYKGLSPDNTPVAFF
jgi:hypothetical protein